MLLWSKRTHLIWNGGQHSWPVVGIMILVAGDWGGPVTLFSWGCSHSWDRHISRWDCPHMQQTTESQANSALLANPEAEHMHRGSEGQVESQSWDPLGDGLDSEGTLVHGLPLSTDRSISREWKSYWVGLFDHSIGQIIGQSLSCADTRVTTRKSRLKIKARIKKENKTESRHHWLHPTEVVDFTELIQENY